jgi:glycerophosphoryl diester phosphodiesterase
MFWQIAKFLDGLQVGGHRGCSADAPENTIQALRLVNICGS